MTTLNFKVDFVEDVVISNSPQQPPKTPISSCSLDMERTQCLCNPNECLTSNGLCEFKGTECVIKSGVTEEESLVASLKTDTLATMNANILKTSGAQTINQKLKLNAGFKEEMMAEIRFRFSFPFPSITLITQFCRI